MADPTADKRPNDDDVDKPDDVTDVSDDQLDDVAGGVGPPSALRLDS